MPEFWLAAAVLLLLTMAIGLVRVIRSPSSGERILAVQLLGTAGIAVLLLLGAAFDSPALADVALIFALLAAVSVAALTRRRRQPEDA